MSNGSALNWAVRSSGEGDRRAILDVVKEAFSNGGRDGSEEVTIVTDTWSLGSVDPNLDLVAVENSEVVGHVLGATGRLGSSPVIGIAPLSVQPTRHREGVGTALMTEL